MERIWIKITDKGFSYGGYLDGNKKNRLKKVDEQFKRLRKLFEEEES